jgi:CRISPR-associated protein Cas2
MNSMFVLVTYDVNTESAEGRRRLRQVARVCENWGQRVQQSVFECVVDPAQWAALRGALVGVTNPTTDSLRFYFLGENWRRRVEHVGAKPGYDPEAPLVV